MNKKCIAPGLHDLLWARLRALETARQPKKLTLFKADARKAHRRIKVLRKDWKFMVAEIKDRMCVNKCGTYGVASAQWYWGRMAALLIRLCYQLHEAFLWILVFVDDFMLLLEESGSEDMGFLFLVFLMILGCPISWQKNYLSPDNI